MSAEPSAEPRVPDDRELVRSTLGGDDRAFEELVRRYQRGLYNLAWRMVRDRETARDLTQDIFVRVHRSLRKYDPVYPFTSWIYRVGTNLCIDHVRRRRLDTVSLDAPIGSAEADGPTREVEDATQDPSRDAERAEQAERVAAILAELPENHRLVLVMRHQRGLSYDEIALALDVPLGTVKARIHRAREAFRKILERDQDREDFAP